MAAVFKRSEVQSNGHDVEYRFLEPNHQILYLREISQPEFDEAGRFVDNFGTWHNITENRKTEEDLLASERRHSLAVRIAGLGYWVWDDIEDRLAWCSTECAEIIGFSDPDQVLAHFCSTEEHAKWVHHEDRTRYRSVTQEAGRLWKSYDIEYKAILPSGEIRHVREIGEPELDANGRYVRTRGTLQDVTERRRLLEELHTRERELSEAQRIGQIGHWRLDLKQRQFTYWSDQLYRIFGVDKNYFQPTLENFHAAIHKDDLEKSKKTREDALAGKRPYKFEHRILRPDGETRIISGEARPEFDNDGNPTKIFGVTQDVTEARQRERALHHSQKIEAIGQLTGGLAHDFNNLLAVIQGNVEFLIDTIGSDNLALQAILRSAQSGAELTKRLLAFARQQPLDPEPVDIGQLIDQMSSLLRRTLGETISIQTQISPDIWPILADRAQMESALLNLSINARDAMPGGGRLVINCKNVGREILGPSLNPIGLSGDFVAIEVTDDGVGMSRDVREQAFNPFFTTKEIGEGSGLGLSMVYGFVTQSDGHVTLRSEPEKGTTVSLFLPRAADAPVHLADKMSNGNVFHGQGKILVIEDNPDVSEIISEMVVRSGYQVVTANDADAARQVLDRGEEIVLILSDVVLTGGPSGADFATEVSSKFPNLKTLFMSGYPAEVVTQRGLLDKDAVWLKKPFSRRELARALMSALGKPVDKDHDNQP